MTTPNDKANLQQFNFFEEINRDELPVKPAPSLKLETTTVWSFPERGKWATHQSDYRGNFAPQVARNIILTYSQEGDLVLDPMVGSGTTLIEARLLNRAAIGYDINPAAVELSRQRLQFPVAHTAQQRVALGDVRHLTELADASVDLILTHPPYANIIKYSAGQIPADLSSLTNIGLFFQQLAIGLREMYRVLKPNRYCAILMGDTRKARHYIPLSFMLWQHCLRVGFVLKEQIIKIQHNTRRAPQWRQAAQSYQFYLIMHEHLFVFRKPAPDEKLSKIRYSSRESPN